MKIDVLTLFPEFFQSPLSVSMMKRGVENGAVSILMHQIRNFGIGKRRQVDDSPYGGGAGLVMKPEVITAAWDAVPKNDKTLTLLMSPRGKVFNQQMAADLSQNCEHLIIVCGHYEGIDQRFIDISGAVEVSVGDYILTGGETAAVCIIDAVVRLLPGVLGNEESSKNESFSIPLLEHDQYTMPRVFRGLKIPKVLTTGDHAKIESWRIRNSLKITAERRPDLMSSLPPSFWEGLK
ncbi:MAG TPA: tRNA (guanosine(37)-N1)-methyltransferase TrmD [bacterium]|nr:tRNA (guanosine(37)-N1)-methyltransferase TrmD [bacterium]MDX9804626.1 tRNA (guanosine(37)-N1)-methyltransferase TrmD [bacterium]HNW15178.1 tRNA (guanosine(37)-N1)-methyltransferase TrmD [bacterium]HOG42992.1 tRNA (guanosine(37)-N1)-methyltransferase TrmD [bacterium]HPA55835.1 tRNA (guanosine(37)-N1)-methyltransferase TrmD [bacterium]